MSLSSLDQTDATIATRQRLCRPQDETPARLIALSSGRRLAYVEYGDREGYPLFYCHSQGSSRLEGSIFHLDARRAGFRIIAIDRPGIGFSDPYPGMKHTDFARTGLELADALDLTEFAVLAWAGGAPYAFALAERAPQRVKLVVSLAGLPAQQHLRPAITLSSGLSQLGQAGMRALLGLRQWWNTRDDGHYLQALTENVCFADRKVLADERLSTRLLIGLQEARRQGSAHVVRDTSRCFDSWDFSLEDIKTPVHLWHGSADTLIPAHYSVRLAERLADATLRIARHRGHLFFMQGAKEILQQAKTALQEERDLSDTWRGAVARVKIPSPTGETKSKLADGRSFAGALLHR